MALWLERFAQNVENRRYGIKGISWFVHVVNILLSFRLIREWVVKEKNALFVENIHGLMDDVITVVLMSKALRM